MAEDITPNHPAYYAEVLNRTTRVANSSPSDERSCPDLPGISSVDDSLTRRLRALLDIAACISLPKRENVSATMACLSQGDGGVNTQIYIAFNKTDEAALRCTQHLQHIFAMLKQVPHVSPADGSTKAITASFDDRVNEITQAIHNYSFDIFAYRVNKRKGKLSDIRRYIEQNQTYFKDDHSTLLDFLEHVDMIIKTVAKADAKQLSIHFIPVLREIYRYWTQHNLLPKDALAHNQLTLLDKADEWLAQEHHIGFQLRRWAVKIMSFVIAANRLFMLTQSHRLRNVLKGKLTVEVLPSRATTQYRVSLTSQSKQEALNTALAGTTYRTADWNEVRQSFIKGLGEGERVRGNPTVHAELAIIMAMNEGKIQNALPYIGVSKLSCVMCNHYIDAFNKVTNDHIVTRGSHGKAYPGWFWPKLPAHDGKIRLAFLKAIRQELVRDFERYAKKVGRLRLMSDSSVGSDAPEVEGETSMDKIRGMYMMAESAGSAVGSQSV